MTMKHILAAAVTCLLAVSGCSDPPEDASKRIKPGVCIAKETKDEGNLAPDLSSIVPCSSAHIYEVYDIVDLPAKALTGRTKQEWIDNRDDLALPSELSADSAQRKVFEEFATKTCTTSLQRVTGYDEVVLDGVNAEDAKVTPLLRGISAPWYTVMPEKEWLDGRRQVVCSARFADAEFKGSGRRPTKPTSAPAEATLVATARLSSFPVDLRLCRAYDAKRKDASLGSCEKPHVSEMLFTFDAEAVLGRAFVKKLMAKPTAKKFNRFDGVCTDALPALLGGRSDLAKVRGFGSVHSRWTDEAKPVRCDVGPKNFSKTDLASGSLVGVGAEKIELVRVR